MGSKAKIKNFSSILIATFSPWKDNVRSSTNGMIEPMLSYFLPHFKKVWLLDQPYPASDKYFPVVEQYRMGKLIAKRKTFLTITPFIPWLFFVNIPGTHIAFKIRDLLSTIEAGLLSKKPFDLFVGMESVNALAGIILRKLGKVKIVCYYVSDYSPKRFHNKWLNNFYLWLDRFAALHSNFIWDVSPAMHPARIVAGLDLKKSAPVILLPNALFSKQLQYVPLPKRDAETVVFVGTLGLENGPDIAVEAFKLVVKKFPQAKLHIVGGGGKGFETEYIRQLITKHGLERNIIFHGFISDLNKLSQMIARFKIAIAPYKMTEGSIRLYGDATKLRLYAAASLPIVTTSVPPLGKELKQIGAAIITQDTAKAFALEIIRLLKNKKEITKMVQRAKKFAQHNTWDNTYKNALAQMKTD